MRGVLLNWELARNQKRESLIKDIQKLNKHKKSMVVGTLNLLNERKEGIETSI